jgi:CHASE2 domain-containing sensor protein
LHTFVISPLRLIAVLIAAIATFSSALDSSAGTFEDDFAVVFIDAATEAKHGRFPLDRALLADAIEHLAAAKSKAVVLKFFYDQPKDTTGDQRLADSLRRLPVALQARMDDTETRPNPLPARFTLPIGAQTAVGGTNGWIPLPLFCEHAKDVGFVDFVSTTVPLLETYRGQTVKSLVLCSMELATSQPSVITPGQKLIIGQKTWKLDPNNQITAKLPKSDDLQYVPFHKVLDKSVSTNAFAGKVVILAYDGLNIHTVDTTIGKVKAHRMFVYSLKSIYEQGVTK